MSDKFEFAWDDHEERVRNTHATWLYGTGYDCAVRGLRSYATTVCAYDRVSHTLHLRLRDEDDPLWSRTTSRHVGEFVRTFCGDLATRYAPRLGYPALRKVVKLMNATGANVFYDTLGSDGDGTLVKIVYYL